MPELINVKPNTPEWLEIRRQGIGGSDAAAVIGVSPYRTPYQVWEEKRGISQGQEDNEYMLWGRTLEPVIRQQYEQRTGEKVKAIEGVMRHEKYPFMLATLDGVTESGRLLEVKTASFGKDWGTPGTDEVPESYLVQVQHYLMVTGLPVADVAVLIGGWDFRLYEVPADKELQEMLADQEAKFWQMVEQDIMPDLQNVEDIKRRFRLSRAQGKEATGLIAALAKDLKGVRADMKLLEERKEEVEGKIKLFLEDCDTLTSGSEILATWKSTKAGERFDSAAFKEAHPAIYKEFCKPTEPQRRFLLK